MANFYKEMYARRQPTFDTQTQCTNERQLLRDRSLFICGGEGGWGGEKSWEGAGPIFSKTRRGGPKENFTMIGGGSLCDCEE